MTKTEFLHKHPEVHNVSIQLPDANVVVRFNAYAMPWNLTDFSLHTVMRKDLESLLSAAQSA